MSDVEIIKRKSKLVAEQRARMDEAFESARDAESELLDSLIALSPALEMVCSAICDGKQPTIWKGLLLDETIDGDTVRRLYVDPGQRLIVCSKRGTQEMAVTPTTAAAAVRQFAVERCVRSIGHSLDRQLQGKSGKRTTEYHERASAIRGLVVMLENLKGRNKAAEKAHK